MVEGASEAVCRAIGIPPEWAGACEDAAHVGHDGSSSALEARLEVLESLGRMSKFKDKIEQLGSYGGGNHFGEAEVVHVGGGERARQVADAFGLRDGHVAFLSHCGSRGFGHDLAQGQFRALEAKFRTWGLAPSGCRSAAGVRPLGYAGGRRVPRQHGARRELRDREPSADQRSRARGVPGGDSGRDR